MLGRLAGTGLTAARLSGSFGGKLSAFAARVLRFVPLVHTSGRLAERANAELRRLYETELRVKWGAVDLATRGENIQIRAMTAKQFYDWQTDGGTDDVMRLVACLEKADITWCAIGGVAVNHWAEEPMVTQDVDFVVATDSIEKAVRILTEAGFEPERFAWSVNFKGRSKVSLQLSTEDFYREFPSRSVPADVHGILLRVASLEDTFRGKLKAWRDKQQKQSKRIKDLGDLARLVESHAHLWDLLPEELQNQIEKP